MLDNNPVPEGYQGRCQYCGKPLALEVDAPEDVSSPICATHRHPGFCGEACARAYEILRGEDREESEEIYRAGAT